MANIQISEKLFFQLFRYHCLSHEVFSEDDLTALETSIAKEIEIKLDKMATRNLYTKSKTAPTPEEREQARQEYLNARGIHNDFRW